jgi:hypothetical protein
MLASLWILLGKIKKAIIIRVVVFASWINGGRNNWNFGRLKLTRDVQLAMNLYQSPTLQKTVTESLLKVVEPVLIENIRQNEQKKMQLLEARMTQPLKSIIVQSRPPRRVTFDMPNDDSI